MNLPVSERMFDALMARARSAEKQARDRDDVIYELARHLRAGEWASALTVIDRYEDGLLKPAFDEDRPVETMDRMDHWRSKLDAACHERDEAYTERAVLVGENQRLREAIADALTDLTPGHAPYSLLDKALKPASDENHDA